MSVLAYAGLAVSTPIMLLDLPTVAHRLGGISMSTVRRLVRDGSLPVVRVRTRVLVASDSLDTYIRTQETVPAEAAS